MMIMSFLHNTAETESFRNKFLRSERVGWLLYKVLEAELTWDEPRPAAGEIYCLYLPEQFQTDP